MLNMYGGQYMPAIPDAYVLTHLGEEQKSVWQGLQKIGLGNWNVWNGQQQIEDNDGWWGDPPVAP